MTLQYLLDIGEKLSPIMRKHTKGFEPSQFEKGFAAAVYLLWPIFAALKKIEARPYVLNSDCDCTVIASEAIAMVEKELGAL